MLLSHGVPIRGRDALKEVLRLFLEPSMLLMFGAILISPWWIPAAIYGYLWSIDATGNGILVWIGLCATGIASLCFWISYFVLTARHVKSQRRLRERLQTGDESAREEYIRRRSENRKHLWYLAAAVILLKLVIPSAVAAELWSTTTPGIAKVHGRNVPTTRQQELHYLVRDLEAKGITRWAQSSP